MVVAIVIARIMAATITAVCIAVMAFRRRHNSITACNSVQTFWRAFQLFPVEDGRAHPSDQRLLRSEIWRRVNLGAENQQKFFEKIKVRRQGNAPVTSPMARSMVAR